MRTQENPVIDCVGLVRKERDRISRDTEGRTVNEILAYFKKRSIHAAGHTAAPGS